MKVRAIIILLFLVSSGCAGMMGLTDPRPKEYQVTASTEMAETATTQLVAAQKVKVIKAKEASTEIVKTIAGDAGYAFLAASDNSGLSSKATANMFQNYMELLDGLAQERGVGADILNTDGLQGTVRKIHHRGTEATEIDTVQMLAHTAAATAGFMGSKEKFTSMTSWLSGKLPLIAGLGIPFVSGIATFLTLFIRSNKKNKKKDAVIRDTGRAIAGARTVADVKKKITAIAAKADIPLPSLADGE